MMHEANGHSRNYMMAAIESTSARMDILIAETDLRQRVLELGSAIRRDVGAETPIHMIAALTGAFVFLADLMRATGGPITCDFLKLSSYGAGASSSGTVQFHGGFHQPLEGRDILIVEDIVDTGRTLSALQNAIRARSPNSIKTVCLLDKPDRRVVEVPVDYVGFSIPDRFVVGYGLDHNERFRNLPFIGVLS
jgi:hypoxanthine phosphoribosyltransferase